MKPGIILGNWMTAAGAFAFISKEGMNFELFFPMLIGLGSVMGSGCVFNNYIDRVSDAKMERTKNRALAKGEMMPWKALVFGTLLGVFGVALLSLFCNVLTASIAALGWAVYVCIYSFLKHYTLHASFIGSIAGAAPPLVGYCSKTGSLDFTAALLFSILVFWQMPHFFAIAIYRMEDYVSASIPVVPVQKGVFFTKVVMLIFCVAFAMAGAMLSLFIGMGFLIAILLLGVLWIWLSIKGFQANDDKIWARNMFRFSLIVITAFCFLIAF